MKKLIIDITNIKPGDLSAALENIARKVDGGLNNGKNSPVDWKVEVIESPLDVVENLVKEFPCFMEYIRRMKTEVVFDISLSHNHTSALTAFVKAYRAEVKPDHQIGANL